MTFSTGTFRFLFCATALLLLSGCAGLVTPPASFTTYDLDVPRLTTGTDGIAVAPASIDVRSPSWLSNAAMQYRLDFRQPSSREAYAESRWAGHPAEMLQRKLVAALGISAGGSGGCRLRLDLDEFIQRFDGPGASSSELIVRASLIAPREESVLARERFVIETPAGTADAAGGVLAHRQGARRLAEALHAWLETLDDDSAQGLNVNERCQR